MVDDDNTVYPDEDNDGEVRMHIYIYIYIVPITNPSYYYLHE